MVTQKFTTSEEIRFRDIQNSNFEKVMLYIGDNPKGFTIGKYDQYNKIFITRKKEKHVLKFLDAFGFNYNFIKFYPIKEIRVRYCNKDYFTTKEYLLKNGEIIRFANLDKQIFLPISEFYQGDEVVQKKLKNKKPIIN